MPRGERYEICRSVHAEVNAIVNASREEMLGSTLYLVGIEGSDGSYVKNANSCSMCKRTIINAGIEKVIIRDDRDTYRIVEVASWIDDDDTLDGNFSY